MRMTMRKKITAALLAICIIFAVFIFGKMVNADEVKVDNGIPVVYVTIDESRGTIAEMNSSPDHSVYCYGTVSIDVPEGFHYVDLPTTECKDLAETEMSIKGRGNSTWGADKKPYKIKLESKKNVLGLGKNKHWVLVANAFDRTLLKDRISGWLGDRIGMPYTPRGEPVDLVMRNTDGTFEKYLGSYYLSEQVRVDDNRIEIEELEEGDVDPAVITGGYLVQIGTQTDENSPSLFRTKENTWANHTPNFDPEDGGYVNDVQRDYIRGYMQDIEDEIISMDFEGEDGRSYRDLMDVNSAARYWLVMELSKNADAYTTGSTYLYKPRGSVMYWGPLWDFDYAWYYDNDYDSFAVNDTWIKHLLKDDGTGGFVEAINNNWPEVKAAALELAQDGGIIDQYYEETKLSQQKDLEIYPEKVPEIGGKEFNPAEAKENLKLWIRNRVAWMDAHLSDIDNLVHKITAVVDENRAYRYAVLDDVPFVNMISKPKKEGYLFTGWKYPDGTPVTDDDVCSSDITILAQFISKEEVTSATDIRFLFEEDCINYVERGGSYEVAYAILPYDAENQDVTWTSSDEDIATVAEYGIMIVKKTGDVVITATLDSGASRSITLHAVDEDLPVFTMVTPDKEVYEMNYGQVDQIHVTREPVNSKYTSVYFESDNPDVVHVNEQTGTISALAPGKANITITAMYYDFAGDGEYEYKTSCEVIVNTPEPEPASVITYRPTEGIGQTWQIGSDESVVFVYKRSVDDEETIDHFKGLRMDGAEVPESAYTQEAGSVIIRIKPEYLETLALGKHSVEPVFDDGEVISTYFAVVRKEKEDPEEDTEENTEEKTEENTEEITTESSSEEITTEGKTEGKSESSTEGKNKKSEATTQSKRSNAKTDDESGIMIAALLGLMSAAGICMVCRKHRSDKKRR